MKHYYIDLSIRKVKMYSKRKLIYYVVLIIVALMFPFISCRMAPKNVKPVTNFDIKKYLGTWFEIARFDFIHEKNLRNVTATYSVNKKGTIDVINKGFNVKTNQWQQAFGNAKFQKNKTTIGALKVSFFGPFYTGYNIISLDPEYKSALVVGKNYNYLWILSRNPTLDNKICMNYLEKANELGFDISKIEWTNQN